MFALGAVHAVGRDVAADLPTAQCWFRDAAEHGHGHAQLILGRFLLSGAAGDLEPAEGRRWLERAAAKGIADTELDLAASPAITAASNQIEPRSGC
jgi:TPR repeat protein